MLGDAIGRLVAASFAFVLTNQVAWPADLPPEPVEVPTESGWSFTVAPYLWMAGLQGDIAQFGSREVEVDVSFSEIIKHFDFGAMGVTEARHGVFGILTDFEYIKLSAEANTPFGIFANDIDVTSKTLSVMAAGEFRLVESDALSVDVLAGGRLWSVRTEIDLNGGRADGTSFDDGDTWVDPIVGAKARADLTDLLYLTTWGMIGGFGVESRLQLGRHGCAWLFVQRLVSMVAGYRAMSVDYENGDFVFDVVQHGPVVGGEFRF